MANNKFKELSKLLYIRNFIKVIKHTPKITKTHLDKYFPTRALVLLYHRVANVKDDPYLLSVSPDNFYQHLSYLKQNFSIISLNELVKNLKKNKLKKSTVTITFDDGYADSLYNALPLLEKLKIPATIFITAGKINDKEPFYWDKNTEKKDQGRALTIKELKELSFSPFIEIGSHTMAHPRLSKISSRQEKKEIVESKRKLEKIIRKPVISFSYPFGGNSDFNKETIGLVKKANYQYACANIQGRVTKKSDPFVLPRRLVRDWNLSEFKAKIKKFQI